MIEKAIAQFSGSDLCQTVHLPFFFTPELKQARATNPGKIIELFRVIGRLFRIRMKGPIDLLIYPTGGPQAVPMIRDLLLLPWMLLMARRVILHFHAAGIADRLKAGSGLARLLRFVYCRTFAAVVLTEFGRRDPIAMGLNRVMVLPLRVADDFDETLVSRSRESVTRILYVGHLCADKGTPQLLEAFAELLKTRPDLELELVGECLPPFSQSELEKRIDDLKIAPHVRVSGLLTGRAKSEAFGRAAIFVFPTVAPYESFGLVLLEAMGWKLPIVASNWRGNSSVLTESAGGTCFALSSSLPRDILSALEQALNHRADWPAWGATNRLIFEERYRDDQSEPWLVTPLLSLIKSAP